MPFTKDLEYCPVSVRDGGLIKSAPFGLPIAKRLLPAHAQHAHWGTTVRHGEHACAPPHGFFSREKYAVGALDLPTAGSLDTSVRASLSITWRAHQVALLCHPATQPARLWCRRYLVVAARREEPGRTGQARPSIPCLTLTFMAHCMGKGGGCGASKVRNKGLCWAELMIICAPDPQPSTALLPHSLGAGRRV